MREIDSGSLEGSGRDYRRASVRRRRNGRRRQVRNATLMVAGVFLVGLLVAGLLVLLTRGGGGPRVPHLIGLTFREAKEKVESSGLEIEIDFTQDSSGDCTRYKVEEQDPKAGVRVEKGELVTVRLKGLPDSPELVNSQGSKINEPPASQPSGEDSRPQSSSPAAGAHSVCIDPGHSGSGPSSEIDPGTGLDVADNSGAPGELQAMWALAERVRSRLERFGYRVSMTKSSAGEYVNLRRRADIGNTCEIVVRLHFDPSLQAVLYPGEGQYKSRGDRTVYVDPGVARGSQALAQAMFPYLQGVGINRIMNDCGGTSNNTGPAFVGSVLSRVPVVLIEKNPSIAQNEPDRVADAVVEGIHAYFQGR